MIDSIIKRRLWEENKDCILFICGDRGSGKSWTALTLGCLIDPNFTIKNVAFTIKEFFQILNSKDTRQGSVIVFDEIGVSLSAKNWYSLENKLTNFVFQTVRHKNLCIIITAPAFNFDSDLRKLIQFYGEMFNPKLREYFLKMYTVQLNPRMNKTYFKNLRFYENNERIAVTGFRIHAPPKELTEAYEKKAAKFKEGLHGRKVMDELDREEREKAGGGLSDDDILKLVLTEKSRYLKSWNRRTFFSREIIAHEFRIGGRRGDRIAEAANLTLRTPTHTPNRFINLRTNPDKKARLKKISPTHKKTVKTPKRKPRK